MTHSPEATRNLVRSYLIEHKDKYYLNAEAYQRLLRLCELTDILSEEFLADSIDIQVSPEQSCGTIYLFTDELVFEHGRSHSFFERIKDADFLGFSNSKDGMLRLRFGVQNLWVAK